MLIERIREALGFFPKGTPEGSTFVQGTLPVEKAHAQREAMKELGIRPVAVAADAAEVQTTYAIPPGVRLSR